MEGRAKRARPERLTASLDVAMDLITDNLGVDRDALEAAGSGDA